MKNIQFALLGLTTSLVACGVTSSENIKTKGIHALMSATATGDGTTSVTASLFLGEPIKLIFVELEGGDELTAYQGTNAKEMDETQILTIVTHYASFDTDAAGTEFGIEFTRGDGADDAPSSTATLPDPFDLAAAPATSSRAADLTLTWTGTAVEPMSWEARGNCIQTLSGEVTEDASLTIAANTLVKLPDPMTPESCEVTVVVDRWREGELDPAFGGGAMGGRQRRQVTFSSTP